LVIFGGWVSLSLTREKAAMLFLPAGEILARVHEK
jgi:hypothetical protein